MGVYYMEDFLGNEIKEGDQVIFMSLEYRSLMVGTIIKLSENSCLISHEPTHTGKSESRQVYGQLIKHPNNKKN
jgi:hypothetical protein